MSDDLNKILGFNTVMSTLGKFGSIETHDLFLATVKKSPTWGMVISGDELRECTEEYRRDSSNYDNSLVIWVFDTEQLEKQFNDVSLVLEHIHPIVFSPTKTWKYSDYVHWIQHHPLWKDKVKGDPGSNTFDYMSGFYVWECIIKDDRRDRFGTEMESASDDFCNAICYMYSGKIGITCPYTWPDNDVGVPVGNMFSIV